VEVDREKKGVGSMATAAPTGQTGVEMEALDRRRGAALTV